MGITKVRSSVSYTHLVIHIGNPADGSGYSYTHDQGIVAMQKAVGLEDDQIIRKNNVADDDQTAIETAMRECVEEGCQIIFATSWGLSLIHI